MGGINMKKPTEQELKEICEKFKLIDVSDDYNEEIFLEKRIDDFVLAICLEIDDNEIFRMITRLSLNLTDFDLTEELFDEYPNFSKFEMLIRSQIGLANEQITKYDKITQKIQEIEELSNLGNLDIEFVKAIVQEEVNSW